MMCNPENTEIHEVYEMCGHSLPQQACDYYANEWQQCLASHDHARDLKVYGWKDGEIFDGFCRSCEEGKDIDGGWKYGKKWAGRETYMKEEVQEGELETGGGVV